MTNLSATLAIVSEVVKAFEASSAIYHVSVDSVSTSIVKLNVLAMHVETHETIEYTTYVFGDQSVEENLSMAKSSVNYLEMMVTE